MGQSHPYKKIALVVEDDALQRETIVTLLEESEMDVIQCESGEAAELVLEHVGGCLTTLLTDVNLAGTMDGIELAQIARERFPALRIVVISANPRDQPVARRHAIHRKTLEPAGAAAAGASLAALGCTKTALINCRSDRYSSSSAQAVHRAATAWGSGPR